MIIIAFTFVSVSILYFCWQQHRGRAVNSGPDLGAQSALLGLLIKCFGTVIIIVLIIVLLLFFLFVGARIRAPNGGWEVHY